MNVDKAISRLFQTLIRGYAFLISPLLGRTCRFEPTCSCYAHEAFERHGAWAGFCLTTGRLLRCHPWSNANWHDPVPERFTGQGLLGYKRRYAPKDDKHCETEKIIQDRTLP